MAINKNKNDRIAAIIPKDIAEKVIELAKKEKRSKSSMVVVLIEKGLMAFQK